MTQTPLTRLLTELTEPTPCAGNDAWLSDNPDTRAQAANQCIDCPLMTACLATAKQRRERFGVWGGRDFTRTATTADQHHPNHGRMDSIDQDDIDHVHKLRGTLSIPLIARNMGWPERRVRYVLDHKQPTRPYARKQDIAGTYGPRLIELREVVGLSWREIGARLGLSWSSAQKAYTRIKQTEQEAAA